MIEKGVAEILAQEAERRGLLSDGQIARRKRQSAIDMAGITVERTHAAGSEGSIATVIIVDIKAAFPSVGRGRLVHTMKGKGIDGDLI